MIWTLAFALLLFFLIHTVATVGIGSAHHRFIHLGPIPWLVLRHDQPSDEWSVESILPLRFVATVAACSCAGWVLASALTFVSKQKGTEPEN
jgi:hypothetical protein